MHCSISRTYTRDSFAERFASLQKGSFVVTATHDMIFGNIIRIGTSMYTQEEYVQRELLLLYYIFENIWIKHERPLKGGKLTSKTTKRNLVFVYDTESTTTAGVPRTIEC